MARLLSELRCGGCGLRFWPERSQAREWLVRCPRCGGAHANAGADRPDLTWSWLPTDAGEWLRKCWVGPVPHEPAPRRGHVVRAGVVAGYACLLVRYEQALPGTDSKQPRVYRSHFTALVAAVPPHARSPFDVGGHAARWVIGGVVMHGTDDRRDVVGLDSALVASLVERVRAQGAEPVFPLEEVLDPQPLDPTQEARELAVDEDGAADARLESRDLRCGHCGAPARVSDLVGEGLCPYCAAPQALASDVRAELRAYQARAHATQLRLGHVSAAALMTAPLTVPSIAHVAQVCVRCGAPGVHRVGAVDEACPSCRAPLTPRRTVMMRVLAALERSADRARTVAEAAYVRGALQRGKLERWLLGPLVVLGAIAPFANLVLVLHDGKASPGFIAQMIAFYAMPAALLAALLIVHRRRVDRWRTRWEALADQLGAPAVDGPEALARWAARWWDDRLSAAWVKPGGTRGTLLTQIAGFAVAVTGQPVAQLGLGGAPIHLVVLLAAELPRDAAYWRRKSAVVQIERDLERAGFRLEIRTGGVALLAEPRALQALQEAPDRLAVLAPITHAMGRLAHLLRARPIAMSRGASSQDAR